MSSFASRPSDRSPQIRRSWRPLLLTDPRRRLRRYLRRAAVAVLALVLIAGLLYLLIPPLLHPHTHLVLITGADYRSAAVAPLEFAAEDAAGFEALQAALYAREGERQPPVVPALSSPEAVSRLVEASRQLSLGDRDALLVYAAAHGVCGDGQAQLLCGNYDPAKPLSGVCSVSDLLRPLTAVGARVKLLILDAGRLSEDALNGAVVNEFPQLLQREVQATGDPQLWVLSASAPLQRSFASAALQRSVFGYFVTLGLGGAADLNQDATVDLAELYRFVSANVAGWTREQSDGAAVQTPVLINGGGRPVDVEPPVLISVSALQPEAVTPSPKQLRTASRSQPFVRIHPAVSPDSLIRPPTPIAQPQSLLPAPLGRHVSVAPPTTPSASSVGKSLASAAGSPAGPPAAAPAAGPAGAGAKPAEAGAKAAPSGAAPAEPGGEKEAAAEGEEAAEKKPPEPQTPPLLIEAWKLRDALEDRDLAAPRPTDFAPELWREFQRQLLFYERQVRAGQGSDDTQIADALRKTILPLQQLLPATETALPDAPPPVAEGIALRIAGRRPASGLDIAQPRSLGLAELAVGHDSAALPAELKTRVEQFDQLAASGQREAFDKWLAELPPEYDQFVEFRTARRLAAAPGVNGETIQDALRTRRLAERVAARSVWVPAWIAPQVDRGDRALLAAERELRDQIGADFTSQARRWLREAVEAYQAAEADAAAVEAAGQLSNELAVRAPFYVSFFRESARVRDAGGPAVEDLKRLFRSMNQLDRLLRRPGAEDLAALRQTCADVQRLRDTLESGLQEARASRLLQPTPVAGDAQRIEVLLSTPLPEADLRLRLLRAVADVDLELTSTFDFLADPASPAQPPDILAEDWRPSLLAAELEYELAKLAAPDDWEGAPALSELDTACEELLRQPADAGEASVTDRFSAHRRFGQALRSFYAALPESLNAAAADHRDLSDADERPTRLQALRAALQASRMAASSDTKSSAAADLQDCLRQAHVYDLLMSQRQRFLLAVADAPADDLAYLADAASHYRQQAAAVPDQPPPQPDVTPRLQVDGPSSVLLTSADRQEFELRFQCDAPPPASAWIVLKYDPELIDVRPVQESKVYREDELRLDLETRQAAAQPWPARAERGPEQQPDPAPATATPDAGRLPNETASAGSEPAAGQYPYRPQQADQPRTFLFPSDGKQTLRLVARRVGTSLRATRLVVKATAGPAYVRHTVEIQLPAPAPVELAVGGVPNSWTTTSDGVLLHPFPNRRIDFRLDLVNHSGQPQSVDVQVRATSQRIVERVPLAAMTPADADRLLDRWGAKEVLAAVSEMALPAEPVATPIAFPKPPDEPPPAKPAPKEAAGGEAAKPAAGSAPAVQELLLVVTDRKTQQRTIRRIQFEPQRPRRFVQARVGYDFQEQRVRIRVSAPNPAVLPPGVLKVRAEFVEPLEEAAERRLEGELRAPDFKTDLYAEIESKPQRIATLLLHVDGYPRAFVFRVPCWVHSVELPEQRDLLDVRIVQLPQGRNYLPVDPVPVRLQVDASDGAFDRPDDVVEVGVDLDRDRELEGEQVVSLRADRQAAVNAVQCAPGGVLTLDTHVDDYLVTLPPAGLQNAPANVVARIIVGARQRWSNVESVVFDALPPRATRIELDPDRLVVQGAELSVLSWVSDDDLSGVAKVEAGLDVQRSGQMATEPKPAEAHLDAAGRWVAKLATADYPPGQYTLLVRATDNLNNSRLFKVRDVRILTEQEAKEEQQKQTNQLAGSVLFGGSAVPQAAVELAPAPKKPDGDAAAKKPEGDAAAKTGLPPEAQRTTTNEQGRFTFPKVPPGDYRVSVKVLLHNKTRQATQDVTIPPPPKRLEPLRFDL